MRNSKFLLIASVALLAASCAHGNKNNPCTASGFYDLGENDGQSGKDPRNLDDAKSKCSNESVGVADDRYQWGYRVGLTKFCTETRARSDAGSHSPNPTCSREKVPPYMAAYSSELDRVRSNKEREAKQNAEQEKKLQDKQADLKKQMDKLNQEKAAEHPADL